MGYLSINNLEKDRTIFLLKRCYALEKIDGTSAHISWSEGQIKFSSGGANHTAFESLFNKEALIEYFKNTGRESITIYGEAYGGRIQKMAETYGKDLRFVAFDVLMDNKWLNVPQAERFVLSAGLEFVDYVETTTDLEALNQERMRDSTQAFRNGMGLGKMREGVILRPLEEMILNNGNRLIVKYRRDEFRENKSIRPITDEKVQALRNAIDTAAEWVTLNRLNHITSKIPDFELDIKQVRMLIEKMTEDVLREGSGEVEDTPEIRKAIAAETARLVKSQLK